MRPPRIALIGERNPVVKAHRGIEASIELYQRDFEPNLSFTWVPTSFITPASIPDLLHDKTGVWCVPNSPYANTAGALLAIEHARTSGQAFLGTCGGFQHALMEFASNVLGRSANHEELSSEAGEFLIHKLSCSLSGAMGKVVMTSPDHSHFILGASESIEEFNCNYGLNEDMTSLFQGSDLVFVAHDELDQVRAFALKHHPFFVGTLFQPERRALIGTLHPVVKAFFDASHGAHGEKA